MRELICNKCGCKINNNLMVEGDPCKRDECSGSLWSKKQGKNNSAIEAMVIPKGLQALTVTELQHLATHFIICNSLQKVTIKNNFDDILRNRYPKEYTDRDNVFFDKYKGKKVYVFKYSNGGDDKDWFILEDNNYPIEEDCFSV